MYWLVLVVISIIMALIFKMFFTEQNVFDNYWIWLIVALVGCWLGDFIMGGWWWMLSGFNVVAGLLGSIVIAWIYTLLFSLMNQSE